MLSRCSLVKNNLTQFTLHSIKVTNRSIHIAATNKWRSRKNESNICLSIGCANILPLRYASNDAIKISSTADTTVVYSPGRTVSSVDTNLPPIPDAPAIPIDTVGPLVDPIASTAQDIAAAAAAAGAEPTFASLGLGGYTPVGMIQQCMEFLHIGCDIPWWGAVIIGTIVVRTLMFPLVVLSQRNAAKMNNNMPQMQVLQMKMTEARQTGNAIESARYAQEMMIFMKEKQMNPLKSLLVPLAQAPVFISFFIGLRKMANVPVESLTTGGMLWFTDLTVHDPLYLLPLITSATLFLTIELGTDAAKMNSQNAHMMKYFLRALPVVIFPFTMHFPGLILCYWCSSNFISLLQVGILRIPKVRDFFKIEKLINHSPDSLPVKPKKFLDGFKESWTNMKITRELQERERIDDIQFQRAGREALVKTYKYDPTKPRNMIQSPQTTAAAMIQAKKR